MTGRFVQGWQVVLADLSLILFITTAAALDPAAAPDDAASPLSSPQSEPVAVYRAQGGPGFARWLRDHGPDPRERLTIAARYAPGGRAAAQAAADGLAAQAEADGVAPRVIVEPGDAPDLTAVFAFDAEPRLARPLQGDAPNAIRP